MFLDKKVCEKFEFVAIFSLFCFICTCETSFSNVQLQVHFFFYVKSFFSKCVFVYNVLL